MILKSDIQIIDKPLENKVLIKIENDYFLASPMVGTIVRSLQHNNTVAVIADSVNVKYGTSFSEDDIDDIIDKHLRGKGIFEDETSDKRNYYLIQIPLLTYPVIFIITNILKFLFVPAVLIALFGLFAVLSCWFSIINFSMLQSISLTLLKLSTSDYILGIILIYLGYLLHEFGHASALRYFNKDCKTIGFGIYLFFPVLYADVTSAWELNKWQRMFVNIGGVYFQAVYIMILVILYMLNYISSIVLGIVFISTLITMLISLLPFLRLDGYWIVTDMADIPNLRQLELSIVGNIYKKLVLKEKINFLPVQIKQNKTRFLFSYLSISILVLIVFYMFAVINGIVYFIHFPVVFKDNIMFLFTNFHYDFQSLFMSLGIIIKSIIFVAFIILFVTIPSKIQQFIKDIKKSGNN